MHSEKAINVLNSFLIINNQRIESYQLASIGIKNYNLKKIFYSFQQSSHQFKSELQKEILNLGGQPLEDTRNPNLLIRIWYRIKNNLLHSDLKRFILKCESTETKIMQIYYDTICKNRELLTDTQHIMLSEHYFSINTAHYKIKSLKNTLL